MRTLVAISLVGTLCLVGPAIAQTDPCPTSVPYGANEAAGHYIQTAALKLYYEDYGTGNPLMVIHGNGGSIADMKCQIDHFRKTRRVIAMDSRAHGKSEKGSGPLTYEQIADDLSEVVTALSLSNVDVLGHSDGGIVAILFALRHPTQVNRVVAGSPNLLPDVTALVPSAIDRNKQTVREAEDAIRRGDTSRDWETQRRRVQMMIDEPHVQLSSLHTITAPTLILGADGDIIQLEHLVAIFKNLPNGQLFIMPGATHGMVRQEAALYNQIAEQFLSRPPLQRTLPK